MEVARQTVDTALEKDSFKAARSSASWSSLDEDLQADPVETRRWMGRLRQKVRRMMAREG